jgi:hypothetical protein
MGDFNDSHNAIRFSDPLVINKESLYHSRTDKKTISCCYNFNSSCPDELYNDKDALYTREDGLIAPLRGKPKTLGDRGRVSNYKFTGDYVLGSNVVTPFSI